MRRFVPPPLIPPSTHSPYIPKKQCPQCPPGVLKPLTDFHVCRAAADGRQGYCKVHNIEAQYGPGGSYGN